MVSTNNLYPIFLKLEKIQTLIIGGGNVGLEKVNFILAQSPNAKIRVVSESVHPKIKLKALARYNIQIVERKFIPDDLDGIKVLIIATNNVKLNSQIYQLAQAKNILANVVDNPGLCDFYTAAVMKKGPIKIAVSSNGVSPTLAKRLRDVFEEALPNEIEDTAQLLGEIRDLLNGDFKEKVNALNSLTTTLISTGNVK